MPIYGLLSTPPKVAPTAATNTQFLDQYMREYDRLERDFLARQQPPAAGMPAARPYTPGAFPQPAPPAAPTLAPPPPSYPSTGSDGGGAFPGGGMTPAERNVANQFGATPISGYGQAALALGALSPLGPLASTIGTGLAMNNVMANQAMREHFGAPPMSGWSQFGGLFGGGLLGALGVGNEAGLGISRDTAQRSYEAAIDRNMGHTFDLSLAPIGSGLAGVFGGSGYGHGPGEGTRGLDMSNVGDGTQDPSGAW